MATYNGEKYIKEQLESIANQSRQPDEVIIYDDASKDRTVETVKKFINENGLDDKWRLIENILNVGYPTSFYKAMKECTGDIVFFSDQDDIWNEDKIRIMAETMEKEDDLALLGCCFGLVDADSENIKSVMQPSHSNETDRLSKNSLPEIFGKYRWPGMVLCFKKSWLDEKNLNTENLTIPHDIFLCTLASEEGRMATIDRELCFHRRHENNAAGEEHRIRKLLNKKRKLDEINTYLNMLYEFEEKEVLATKEGKDFLANKRASMDERRRALTSRNVFKVIGNGIKNRKYTRFATFACDVIIVFQK